MANSSSIKIKNKKKNTNHPDGVPSKNCNPIIYYNLSTEIGTLTIWTMQIWMGGIEGYTVAAASSIISYQSHHSSSSSWWASWIMVCQGDWTCLLLTDSR